MEDARPAPEPWIADRSRTAVDDADDPRPDPPRVQVRTEATCPLCLEPLTALPKLEVCGDCRTIHHAGCVDEFARCGTPGCRGLTRSGGPSGPGLDESARGIAAVAHLGNIAGAPILLPLVLYFVTRHERPFAAHHAWRALVFSLVSIPLSIVTLGLWVPVMLVLTLRAAYRAWKGEWVPYGRREPAPAEPSSKASSKPSKVELPAQL